ncbi:MAG: mechanosensitive ion channel, partial [Alcaligenaceae bacterium]|nr:mechanosensitive ion channel [Alcaligenaceae bacterium]
MSFFNSLKGMSLMEILTQFVLPYGIKIVLAIAIYVVGRKLVNWLSRLIVKASFRASKDQILADFLGTIFGFVGFLLVVMLSLSQVGVDTTSFVAILGAAGLAVGLSLQDSLANFASGIIMLVFKPFR